MEGDIARRNPHLSGCHPSHLQLFLQPLTMPIVSLKRQHIDPKFKVIFLRQIFDKIEWSLALTPGDLFHII